MLGSLGTAPRWMHSVVGDVGGDAPPPVGPGGHNAGRVPEEIGGVHVMPPRTTRLGEAGQTPAVASGYQWGSGNRLGNR